MPRIIWEPRVSDPFVRFGHYRDFIISLHAKHYRWFITFWFQGKRSDQPIAKSSWPGWSTLAVAQAKAEEYFETPPPKFLALDPGLAEVTKEVSLD